MLTKEICNAESKKVKDDEIRKQLKENNYPINLINKFYRKINNTTVQQLNHSDQENPPNLLVFHI